MKTQREKFDKHNCDKGNRRHRYDRVYEPILKHLRNTKFNMLEVGILHGESMESHLEYFTEATLYGIDIFGRGPVQDIPVLKKDRVNWCKCDSIAGINDDFKTMVGDMKFDVIIDDGLHTHDSQRRTFENLIPYLKEGGTYFIEDVWPFDRMDSKQRQHTWMLTHTKEYSDAQYNALMKVLEPYSVRYHDYRDDTQPDTFIIEIKK